MSTLFPVNRFLVLLTNMIPEPAGPVLPVRFSQKTL